MQAIFTKYFVFLQLFLYYEAKKNGPDGCNGRAVRGVGETVVSLLIH